MNWTPILERLRHAFPEYQVHYINPPTPTEDKRVEISLSPGSLDVEVIGEIGNVAFTNRRGFSVSLRCESTEEDQLVENLISRTQDALIGYRPSEHHAVQYEGGDMEVIDGRLVRWSDNYVVTYNTTYSYSN